MAVNDPVVLSFATPTLPSDTFDVVDFAGEEHISRCFQFEVNLLSDEKDLAFADVFRQPATLTVIHADQKMHFHGTVVHFEQGNFVGQRFGYRVVLAPFLRLLSLQLRSRAFRDLSVPDIVKAVLKENGLAASKFRFETKGTYKAREYCVQYRETDLDFIQRLCEHEGIHYYFVPEEGEDIVVFADAQSGIPKIPNDNALVYNPGGGLQAAADAVREFVCQEKAVANEFRVKDYNYRGPDAPDAFALMPSPSPMGAHYEFGPNAKDGDMAEQFAFARAFETFSQHRVMTGRSGFTGLHTGHTFTLKEHFRDDFNIDYRLTDVWHEGSQASSIPGATAAAGQAVPTYSNAFRCIPASASYAPPRLTPVPQIPGLTTAVLETTGGDYAHLDEEGRYKMRMHFDGAHANQAEATHWIRMNQPYSGPGYGIHFPNHAGMEALLAYVNGDPDRPIALGTSPNNTNKSPSKAANKWQNVIRTWGRNELTFDDQKGQENIYMHATKDHTVDVTNDQSITVGHDRTKHVDHDQREVVRNDKSIQVDGFHTETIGKDMTLTVAMNETETIGLNCALTVGVSRTVTVGVNQDVTVGANLSETVGNHAEETVGKNKSSTVGEHWTVTAGKNAAIKIGEKTTIESGKDLTITGKKKAVIAITEELVLKCGDASITMKKDGTILIKGKDISIEGSGKINAKANGDMTLKAAKIAEN